MLVQISGTAGSCLKRQKPLLVAIRNTLNNLKESKKGNRNHKPKWFFNFIPKKCCAARHTRASQDRRPCLILELGNGRYYWNFWFCADLGLGDGLITLPSQPFEGQRIQTGMLQFSAFESPRCLRWFDSVLMCSFKHRLFVGMMGLTMMPVDVLKPGI